jgi:pyruvate/2-oxoglutarate dehydrogenase complex dihydrolipoamide dehydrogenase (E3) component
VEKDKNIEVHLDTEVTKEILDGLKAMNPYAVILASGGKPIIPSAIPGISKGLAHSDILDGTIKMAGKSVVVAGEGMSGLETAEKLAEDGNKVTLVEMMPIIGNGIYFYNVRRTRHQLEEKGVVIKTSTALHEIKGGSVVLTPAKITFMGTALEGIKNIAGVGDSVDEDVPNGPYEITADATVLSLGVRPDLSLLDDLYARFDKVIYIGDCSRLGKIGDATSVAYFAVKNL